MGTVFPKVCATAPWWNIAVLQEAVALVNLLKYLIKRYEFYYNM